MVNLRWNVLTVIVLTVDALAAAHSLDAAQAVGRLQSPSPAHGLGFMSAFSPSTVLLQPRRVCSAQHAPVQARAPEKGTGRMQGYWAKFSLPGQFGNGQANFWGAAQASGKGNKRLQAMSTTLNMRSAGGRSTPRAVVAAARAPLRVAQKPSHQVRSSAVSCLFLILSPFCLSFTKGDKPRSWSSMHHMSPSPSFRRPGLYVHLCAQPAAALRSLLRLLQ